MMSWKTSFHTAVQEHCYTESGELQEEVEWLWFDFKTEFRPVLWSLDMEMRAGDNC